MIRRSPPAWCNLLLNKHCSVHYEAISALLEVPLASLCSRPGLPAQGTWLPGSLGAAAGTDWGLPGPWGFLPLSEG